MLIPEYVVTKVEPRSYWYGKWYKLTLAVPTAPSITEGHIMVHKDFLEKLTRNKSRLEKAEKEMHTIEIEIHQAPQNKKMHLRRIDREKQVSLSRARKLDTAQKKLENGLAHEAHERRKKQLDAHYSSLRSELRKKLNEKRAAVEILRNYANLKGRRIRMYFEGLGQ